MEIVISDPTLVVLVGAAGSGKSTFAARHFRGDEILSSDRYRALLSGDEADQRVTKTAFHILGRDVERRLRGRQMTVVDATSVEPSARRSFAARARAAGIPVIAIVFDLPEATIIARNAERSRIVDEQIIDRHLARLRRSLDGDPPPIATEGFDRVVILRDPADVDRVSIRRRPPS